MRDELLQRIVKGAEYIESIGKDHPKYTSAMERYDDLCAQLEEIKKRERQPTDVQGHIERIKTILKKEEKPSKWLREA